MQTSSPAPAASGKPELGGVQATQKHLHESGRIRKIFQPIYSSRLKVMTDYSLTISMQKNTVTV